MSVCLFLSFYMHISWTICSKFTKFFALVAYGCGSVLFWQHCNILCTSGFVDYNHVFILWTEWQQLLQWQHHCSMVLVASCRRQWQVPILDESLCAGSDGVCNVPLPRFLLRMTGNKELFIVQRAIICEIIDCVISMWEDICKGRVTVSAIFLWHNSACLYAQIAVMAMMSMLVEHSVLTTACKLLCSIIIIIVNRCCYSLYWNGYDFTL